MHSFRKEFRTHRQRMLDFLKEVEINLQLPKTYRAYAKAADKVRIKVLRATFKRWPELGHFACLGAACCNDAIIRLIGELPSDDMRDTSVKLMNRYKLKGEKLYEQFLVEISVAKEDDKDSDIHFRSFLTPALDLLVRMIEPLAIEKKTCFVAMPFKPPFLARFNRIYRPLAYKLECSAYRMWGGLSGEAYVDLMLEIIRHCGVVMADISGANPNVVYEVGVARGLSRSVLLLYQNGTLHGVPANIISDSLPMSYSPREHDTVASIAEQVIFLDFALKNAGQRRAKAKRANGQALPVLPADAA